MSSGLHNLSTVLKRLEAVASRLEDVYNVSQTAQVIHDEPDPNAQARAAAAAAAGPPPVHPPPPPAPVEQPLSVIAFEAQIMQGKVKPFIKLTDALAVPSVIEQAKKTGDLFNTLNGLIKTAGACKKPDPNAFAELLLGFQPDIESITKIKDSSKERDWVHHLSMLSEGASCIGWVAENKPGPFVNDIKDSSQFYGNRIIQNFKEKDPKHVEWVRAYMEILDELKKYIMEHHTTGLVWNAKGITISQYQASAGGGPPPPPPPPPAVIPAPNSGAPAGGHAALFADLSRGEDVTKGLRKVDKNEMTHKNPALRGGSTVPSTPGTSAVAPKKPIKPSKPHALMGKKPSKFALEGSKWVIEYQENEKSLIVENGELNQIVSLFGCKNSTIVIKGKVNAVTIVNCTKTSVLVGSVIASVSVTNSPSFTLQITGSAPTIQLDSTDSGQIYLSKDCLGVEITTAKCSSINVSLPVEGEEDGVFEEKPVPEMLRTLIQGGKLVTTVVEHVG
ncbi:cyclase-associated-like protein [Heterobasidion irregulare TC 32-1]|uniref:Adenylyl cyclase-associated protein n=1 Tax=Heterobasidion irregulare (strain TC 32-1) TaxID=747525 RepID=W4KHY0_HETIT|nr:cyclase-associated-like protein [Heterobasidion irregulare TC 32-1]ETW85468.1 cyclase-associated-like protein [Heterobasidion irregulare TC 32-1]